MKKGYWVVVYRSVSNESAVKAYGALALPIHSRRIDRQQPNNPFS
jgi:hypothetical protein